jgi:putative transposase
MNLLADHVHMFVEIPPSMCVSRAFQLLKGVSARIIKRNFYAYKRLKSVWSKGKFFRSIGNVTKDVIENYIKYSQGSWNYFDQRRASFLDTQISLKGYPTL